MPASAVSKGKEAEKAYEAYLKYAGYATERAWPDRMIIPGRKFPISRAHDFLGAFDIIAIGPGGIILSQVTAAAGELSRKRDTVAALPYPSAPEFAFSVHVQVVYAEKVKHPHRRGKCWRFVVERLNTMTMERTGWKDERTSIVFWDGEQVISKEHGSASA